MPAQAGIQVALGGKMPNLDSRVRGNDEKEQVDFESTQLESLGFITERCLVNGGI